MFVNHGKRIYSDEVVVAIVKYAHTHPGCTSTEIFSSPEVAALLPKGVEASQISAFVNGNPRFRSTFIDKYGEKAYTAYKKSFRKSSTKEERPPMDFKGFNRLAVQLAIHTRRVPAKEEPDDDED